jgi:AraC family transcriptional regulator
MEWVELGTARTRDLVEGITSLSTGALWNGISLHVVHTRSGEIPEGYVFNHALVLTTSGPESCEQYLPGAGWKASGTAPMTLRFFPARMPYAIRWRGAVDAIAVEISPECVATIRGPDETDETQFHHWSCDENALLTQTVLALANDARAGSPAGPLYGECLGVAIVAELLRQCATAPNAHFPRGLPPKRLHHVLDYIQSHLEGDLSLLSLATVAEVGIDGFVRLFKQSTGFSPHQYVLRRRIDRAQALLGDPALSLTEIAFRSGFSDQSHFTRMFHRFTGVPPRTYRATLR